MPTAKVSTRAFGFSLGKLGFKYTARDYEVDPGPLRSAKAFRDRAYQREQVQNIDIERLKERLSEPPTTLPTEYEAPAKVSKFRRKQGILSYAMTAMDMTGRVPSTPLAVV